MQPAPELRPLDQNDSNLSDLLQNANENYGKYHELSVKYHAWQEWYKAQHKIFEDIK